MVPVGDNDLADSSLQLLQCLFEQTNILWLVGLTSVNQDTAAQGWRFDMIIHHLEPVRLL